MQELVDKIAQWHHDRNLIDGATDKNQFIKLIQEFGELNGNLFDGKDIRDDIGDMMVVMINITTRNGIDFASLVKAFDEHNPSYIKFEGRCQLLARELGFLGDKICKSKDLVDTLTSVLTHLLYIMSERGYMIDDCLAVAYDDIKDRKGKMIDGIFVKEADL